MDFKINFENAISNKGNLYRLKSVMKRAENGEKLVIGFIGGSITQGSLSSTPEKCYAFKVFKWWEEKFPQSSFVYCNAGIGGTTSQFGVARVQKDLLDRSPDFVIVEFSVNDDSTEHFLETYEGIVRKIYQYETKPAVLLVHNVYYNNGSNAQIQHSKIGRHYELPSVSMQSSIYPEVVAGKISNRDITSDDLHPNDKGHQLVSDVIKYYLDKVYKELKNEPVIDDKEINVFEPLTNNRYENSVRYDNKNNEALLNGFIQDEEPQNGITDCFKNGWYSDKVGDSIEMEIEGTGVSIQYRKTINKPAPVAKVYIDGKETGVLLDGNFDEDWGDKLELDTITENLENTVHKVKVELVEANEVKTPFYLVSMIAIR